MKITFEMASSYPSVCNQTSIYFLSAPPSQHRISSHRFETSESFEMNQSCQFEWSHSEVNYLIRIDNRRYPWQRNRINNRRMNLLRFNERPFRYERIDQLAARNKRSKPWPQNQTETSVQSSPHNTLEWVNVKSLWVIAKHRPRSRFPLNSVEWLSATVRITRNLADVFARCPFALMRIQKAYVITPELASPEKKREETKEWKKKPLTNENLQLTIIIIAFGLCFSVELGKCTTKNEGAEVEDTRAESMTRPHRIKRRNVGRKTACHRTPHRPTQWHALLSEERSRIEANRKWEWFRWTEMLFPECAPQFEQGTPHTPAYATLIASRVSLPRPSRFCDSRYFTVWSTKRDTDACHLEKSIFVSHRHRHSHSPIAIRYLFIFIYPESRDIATHFIYINLLIYFRGK